MKPSGEYSPDCLVFEVRTEEPNSAAEKRGRPMNFYRRVGSATTGRLFGIAKNLLALPNWAASVSATVRASTAFSPCLRAVPFTPIFGQRTALEISARSGDCSSKISESNVPKSPGKKLREAASAGTLQVPGAFNALAARLIERSGFSATYLSGAAFSAGVFALPDIGLFTLTELVSHTRCITAAVDIPLIVDADTGFGEALNLERTVRELENAGAGAIQLEDQIMPKRCGHLSGKTLVSCEEMCAKIRAAASVRQDRDLVILARTDARGVHDMDDAVSRARAYVEAGADWIFPEALQSLDEFASFSESVDAPLVANMTEFGKSPLLHFHDLSEMKYAAVLYPVTLLRLAMKQAQHGLEVIKATGSQESLLDAMQSRQELYDLLDYSGFEERDRAHFQASQTSD